MNLLFVRKVVTQFYANMFMMLDKLLLLILEHFPKFGSKFETILLRIDFSTRIVGHVMVLRDNIH